MTSVCEEVDGLHDRQMDDLRKENGALQQRNKELEIKIMELQRSNDNLKAESAVLSAVIDQLNVQLSEKSKPLGDMANFSGLANPETVWL